MIHQSDTWYEIQYSVKGADDWFSCGTLGNIDAFSDTIERAREKLAALANLPFDFRIVKVTRTEEVAA